MRLFFLLTIFISINSFAFSQSTEKIDYFYYKRGLTYKANDQHKKAIEQFNKFVYWHPNVYKNVYYHRGYSHWKLGNIEKAMEDFNQMTEIDPLDTDGQFALGEIYYEQGEYEEALDAFDRVLDLEPKNPKALNHKGMAHCFRSEFDLAMNHFTAATELNPNFAMAFNNAGSTTYYNQDIDDPSQLDIKVAIDYYSKALAINPNLEVSLRSRGLMKYLLADYEGAIADFMAAKQVIPDDHRTYLYLAITYNALNNTQKAFEFFDISLSFNKEYPYTYEEMAHIQQTNGNLNGALDLLNQAASFSSNEQTEYKGLIELKKAILYAQLDNKNNAIEAIKTAHKYKVFDDQRVFNLFVKEKALDKLHNVKKYEKLIKEIRRGKKSNKFLTSSLGWFRISSY